jgi:hypothetical protein
MNGSTLYFFEFIEAQNNVSVLVKYKLPVDGNENWVLAW